jgi:predicted permease
MPQAGFCGILQAMLNNLIICVNAVVPSMIYLTIGILLKAGKVVTEDEVRRFTHMVFVALYPFIMFDNLYGKNISEHLNMRLGCYALGFTALQLVISWVLVCRIEPDNYERGAMIQALFRSNYVLMGFPIAYNLFGRGNITAVAVIMMMVVPFYNAAAVVVFETFRGGKIDIKYIFHHSCQYYMLFIEKLQISTFVDKTRCPKCKFVINYS